jgi:endogenous inhibitor of DNA gyrase (YacG/DUF329 family)
MRAPARHDCPICGHEAPPRRYDGGSPGWLDGGYRIPGPELESLTDLDEEAVRRPDRDGE